VRPLTPHAFNQRRDRLHARLDRLGRVDLRDAGANRASRKLLADVVVPGQEADPGLPDEVRLRYQEWWARTTIGWARVRYDYDFFDLLNGGRLGYHLHPLGGRESVPHAVCVLADGTGEGRHYEAHEVDLLAAHEEFEAQYATGHLIDCRGLRALDVLRLTFGSFPELEVPERAEWGDR
jgi:hypothetical protein